MQSTEPKITKEKKKSTLVPQIEWISADKDFFYASGGEKSEICENQHNQCHLRAIELFASFASLREILFFFFISIFLSLFLILSFPTSSFAEMKLLITSPKPAETISGKTIIKCSVSFDDPITQAATSTQTAQATQTTENIDAQTNATATPSTYFYFFIDFKFAGQTTNLAPDFELDTARFNNGVHIITVNAYYEPTNSIAAYSVKVRFKNL